MELQTQSQDLSLYDVVRFLLEWIPEIIILLIILLVYFKVQDNFTRISRVEICVFLILLVTSFIFAYKNSEAQMVYNFLLFIQVPLSSILHLLINRSKYNYATLLITIICILLLIALISWALSLAIQPYGVVIK